MPRSLRWGDGIGIWMWPPEADDQGQALVIEWLAVGINYRDE
jgi:hypothetical protein